MKTKFSRVSKMTSVYPSTQSKIFNTITKIAPELYKLSSKQLASIVRCSYAYSMTEIEHFEQQCINAGVIWDKTAKKLKEIH